MNILVSGAGVAGLSQALNLATRGHQVTVIERSGHFRVNGSPIDVRGDALGIAEKMGLLDRIREQRVHMTERSVFVDQDGEPIVQLPVSETSDSGDDVEIAREDLANLLAGELPAGTTVRFHDSVTALADDGDGVDVQFASGAAGRFDLVIGADGLHSAVRRLAFGPERDYLKYLGCYVALSELPSSDGQDDRINPIYNYPGHMAGITRYHDKALAVLMFRSELLDYDYHDLDVQKKIVIDAFAGHPEWKIPELLDAVRDDPELYFDSASQIHLPTWHTGRIVLVGDAAHAASGLSGRGTSLALTGAWFLAEELDRANGDHTVAFERYEARQRPYVHTGQASVGAGADLVVPATREAINARNNRILAAAADVRS
ncbi:FAD-dependent monooxygenase [Amycolatopsis sp. NPDC088138]|uniref:FAD-dependent monooxygenase n=1 Tax=Amycolatopsis sp. NPDC088138 TaxID=3363938 RepID=UPI0037FE48E6